MPRGHVLPNGGAIAALRGEAGLTQDQLATRAGYGLRTIGKIEGGAKTTAPTLAAIATVLSEQLSRTIHTSDLLRASVQFASGQVAGDHDLLVAENVQWLDFSAPLRDAAHLSAHAVLTDTFCVRECSKGEAEFFYAADGSATAGFSLSHPQTSRWISDERAGDSDARIDDASDWHVLRVTFPARRQRNAIVQNRVVFAGSESLLEKRRYRTRVMYPTDSLTLLVQFPAECPYRSLRGMYGQAAAESLHPAVEQPIGITSGRLAYWRIAAPEPGRTYQLDWT